MAVRRFHLDGLEAGLIELSGDQAEHARRVLRLTAGDVIQLFDGQGRLADGTVMHIGRTMTVQVGEVRACERRRPWIDVAAAVPKGARADTLIEKLSELDADRLQPLVTERSVVDPGGGKLQRFERIALESSKQCGRLWVMQIAAPAPIEKVLGRSDHDVKLLADAPGPEGGAGLEVVIGYPPRMAGASRVLVCIGPEGGWTTRERQLAREAGCVAWHFAPNVLRIETAAAAAVAILRQQA